MAFTTKVITDTSPDFGDNPQTITESGKPASVEVNNLIPNTAHWTKAEIWQDGVLNDTSNVETFTTLPAGTLTLEYIQTTRSGYGYDVTYRYTSTYAPSSAILQTNGTQFQGFINSEQHTVSFWVTGLTAGTAYLTNVTLYDIYAESVTVMGSIVTTVVNEVRITNTTPSETSVECELDYVIDDGFTVGYVEYWLSTQDPATEQPQAHFYFNNGDTSVIADGLTAGTAYLFRATILLGDGTTEIHSSVVSATTTVNYADQYFTITNESGSNNTISITNSSYANPKPLYWSVDNGTTWNSVRFGGGGTTTITTLSAGQKVIFHHKGRMASEYYYQGYHYYENKFSSTENISASGNLLSLAQGSDFRTNTGTYTYQWLGIFRNCTKLISAKNLVTTKNNTGTGGMEFMFYGCTSLVEPMDLSPITNVYETGLRGTFYGCTSLVSPPNTSNIVTVGPNGLSQTFEGCTLLASHPNLTNVREVGDGGMGATFRGCVSLRGAISYNSLVSAGAAAFGNNATYSGTYENCTALVVPPEYPNLTSVGERTFGYTFYGCTNLPLSPNFKNIASVGNKGFYGTFSGCRSLERVYAPSVSTWDTAKFSMWLNNVSAAGTIYKPSGLTIPASTISGVPTGWTTQDY